MEGSWVFILNQCFSTRDYLLSQQISGKDGDSCDSQDRGGAIASSGQRPEMLLNIPQCTGEPCNKEYGIPKCHQS